LKRGHLVTRGGACMMTWCSENVRLGRGDLLPGRASAPLPRGRRRAVHRLKRRNPSSHHADWHRAVEGALPQLPRRRGTADREVPGRRVAASAAAAQVSWAYVSPSGGPDASKPPGCGSRPGSSAERELLRRSASQSESEAMGARRARRYDHVEDHPRGAHADRGAP
jgi:hypothetical protein